ncbi:MAG: isoprenylcysteine carboxylmethyltransferase family protein [Chloroflexota bacterium]
MANGESDSRVSNEYRGTTVKAFLSLLLILGIVFIPAGRIDYWQGWLFVGVNVVVISALLTRFVTNPDFRGLGKERMKPGPGTKWWDKVFYAFYVPAFFLVIVVGCLDVGRFVWTTELPWPVYIIGAVALAFSDVLVMWAMWTNKFFSSVVRIQTDRGQTVVQSGPYRFVRHPGYVAAILMGVGSSLTLGSLWGLVPAATVAILLVVRTYLEDITLRRELPGYADYARKVRHRLLPGVW